jgi:hypothetical protein
MKRRLHMALMLGGSCVLAFAGTSFAQKVHENQEIRRTLKFAPDAQQRQLVVDNISGEISVTGYDGADVQLVAHEEIEGESKEKIEEAKREVVLDIKEEGNKIILYVDAPWRCRDGVNYRGWHYYGYDVTYDFELKVPHKTSLYLKTVNHGKVLVDDVEGEFEVRDVNAGIEMTRINGPVNAVTVNGPVKVSFTRNPQSDCFFKTVNGKVEVTLRNGLNADLAFKTFNGQVYTDFEVTGLPRKVATIERRSGRRKIYRRGEYFSVRAGKGGTEFSFDTLNGNIYVLKQD